MLGLNSIKETKVYQEAFAEGEQIGEQRGEQRGEQIGEQRGEQRAKISLIPTLINEGFTVAKIAQILDLPLDIVQKISQEKLKDN